MANATLLTTTTFESASGNYDGINPNFLSERVPGDGFYGFVDGNHTVFWSLSEFQGSISIQGSLAEDPQDDDWFFINLGTNDDSFTIQTSVYNSPSSDKVMYNFLGNIVWIRALIENFTAGTINIIQLKH